VAGRGATAEFERLYRANVDAVTAYFARRSADPQVVADLTADTFVAVITSFGSFDPRKGTGRAWVFGIARRVYASYCEACSQQQHKTQRLAGRRDLSPDHIEELLDRIDAERAGRHLVSELAQLPAGDRAVVELVDIAGLRPRKRPPRSGWPRARCGCGSCGPAPACAGKPRTSKTQRPESPRPEHNQTRGDRND
jgi:RNA polymerase sigma-70 factor (ECF subfamily)